MSFLEQRFLRQFREDGDAYVIVRRGREVRFSPTEVAGFLEEWRLLWRASWLWTGWLMIGVIAPLWIASKGHTAGALILASIAVLFMVVVLTPVWQKPGEVAESRLPFEPDAERAPPVVQPPSWWQLALFGVILLIYLYPVVRTGGQDLSKYTYFLLWAGLFAISAWDMFQYKRGKWMPGKRDVVWMLIFCTMTAATVTATVLNPTRGLLDIVIATIFAGLLATILLAPLWKRLRPQPRAA